MLPQTGERQVAEHIEGIKPNHRQRYQFGIDKIKEHFCALERPITILDAACGVGYGTMMIAESLADGSDLKGSVLGVDIFEGAVEAAKRAYKLDNNDFMQLDLGNSDLWNEKIDNVDAIVSIETIEHVKDAEDLIKRYAEKTNFLIGSVPNEDVVPFNAITHPFHFRHYTNSEFETLLNDYGFKIKAIGTQYDKIPGFVYPGDDGYGNVVCAIKE